MVRKYIKEFLWTHKVKYIFGITALICSGVLTLAMPKLLGYIIDCLGKRSVSPSRIAWLTGGMLLMAMIIFGLKYLWRNLSSGARVIWSVISG